jgi:hypothetical protein
MENGDVARSPCLNGGGPILGDWRMGENFFSSTGEEQWSGRFLDIIGWDPSVCKSNRLHVGILRFSIIELGYIL